MKYEKFNFIHIQTKDNLVILTHKIDTLIILTTFFKKYEKCKENLHIRTKGIFYLFVGLTIWFLWKMIVSNLKFNRNLIKI